MILADTSIWVDHLGRGDPEMMQLLRAEQVLVHPVVIGEVALGNLRDRSGVLARMARLPSATIAHVDEVATLIESVPLYGRGVGYVDACLLASTVMTASTVLWTRDRRLHAAAAELGCAR